MIYRYSRTLARLYKMNFSGSENERKRIASDLHDQLGYKIMVINKSIEQLENKYQFFNDSEFQFLKNQLKLLQSDIRKVIDSIHPHDLKSRQWKEVFEHLIQTLNDAQSTVSISFKFNTQLEPKEEHLIHVYRIVQEKLSNIMNHTNSSNISIIVKSKEKNIVILIIYLRKLNFFEEARKFNVFKKGRGLENIQDRLNIIGAKNSIFQKEEFIYDEIVIPT